MTPISQTGDIPRYSLGKTAWPRVFVGLERVAASILIVIFLPVLIFTAILIALLSRRSPLVSHLRVGLHGEALPMLKFRTMWAKDDTPGTWFHIEQVCDAVPGSKNGGDRRVSSRFAAFCRRHSVDELTQLYHVARGQMSLVGPRPITRLELETHYAGCIDEVLSVRPGMTGLWQVMGRNRLTYARRRRLDLLYVRRRSPGMYLWILLRSIPGVLRGDGAC